MYEKGYLFIPSLSVFFSLRLHPIKISRITAVKGAVLLKLSFIFFKNRTQYFLIRLPILTHHFSCVVLDTLHFFIALKETTAHWSSLFRKCTSLFRQRNTFPNCVDPHKCITFMTHPQIKERTAFCGEMVNGIQTFRILQHDKNSFRKIAFISYIHKPV